MKKIFLVLALGILLSMPTTTVAYASELSELSKKMARDYDEVENQVLVFIKSRPWFIYLGKTFSSAYEPGFGLRIRQDRNSSKELSNR